MRDKMSPFACLGSAAADRPHPFQDPRRVNFLGIEMSVYQEVLAPSRSIKPGSCGRRSLMTLRDGAPPACGSRRRDGAGRIKPRDRIGSD